MTLSSPPKSVAIIGAGFGGLVLALTLHKYGIQATIYEMRNSGAEGFDIGGAVMLSPNSLRVLDSLNMYQILRGKAYSFETITFKTDHDFNTTGVYYFGHEETYGYKALRIYTRDLVMELQKAALERGVLIRYGQKYSHIVSETDQGVTFAFTDGTTATAALLVGADGIHSKVRQHLYPDIEPTYAGSIGVIYAIPTSTLRLPPGHEDFPFPVLISGKNGAFVMAPQNADGKELFVGRQFTYPMRDRLGWDALSKSRTELITMHQKDMDQWSDLVRSAQEQASTSTFTIWPSYTVPHVENWVSRSRRVVILGDAAHAIPQTAGPMAGQGANQAAEDGLSFAIMLKSLSSEMNLVEGLKIWQDYRQGRMAKVMQFNDQLNATRRAEDEKRKLGEGGEGAGNTGDVQLGWLYSTVVEEDMAREISNAV